MADLIDRQKAINAVKRNAPYRYKHVENVILEDINVIPSVDAVEVVRCKDCKYSVDEYEDGNCYCKRPSHELVWIGENWDFFCADARKKGGA